ncbi:MAG: magnesium transporter [Zunongwangia sp.]|jgi:magnesium transporter|uniref:magnesium transporter n=1 Tax=Zunongwangia TaxID=417127 RepID=UPI000C933730|nr:magnesium transporter [Zunongwangia profunda]MAG88892.1 magnesium transporter [Flavobacteriaceae bacterium]MAO35843.1 magnesium transporter [Zunongwangia sp.]MCC4227400.1 magnesium transporter [Zunongwangia profunda]|tara:strand:- start:3415 stop:4770 length:1356 start_codon:yes stop_codon:yes gene_type:complete
MQFQISTELIEKIQFLIEQRNDEELLLHLEEVHHADIAEIITELSLDDATYLVRLLDSGKTSEAIMELEEGVRERILETLSAKEIADELVEMDTDDAADIMNELSPELQKQVISEIQDEQHAEDIVELLRYPEDSAGGLMAKELVKVNENWSVTGCMTEMRAQAENVTRVHSIYVVDDKNRLKGRLSLKDLLTAASNENIRDVYIPNVDYVNVHTEGEEVARIMQKYDLEAIPVIDEMGRLVGRITIDDIVDFIKEEAERDYQMAAGISEGVEADDNIFKQTRARLPWLLIGMFGGLGAAGIISGFQGAMAVFPKLLLFVPLIQATAGNVGVQSSAIVVQGLANGSLKGNIIAKRLLKETSLALVNGISIAMIVFIISSVWFDTSYMESLSIGVALISVILLAAMIGTVIPIVLDKNNIDPAVATGPFITTSNDVFGILTYFLIAKVILGF